MFGSRRVHILTLTAALWAAVSLFGQAPPPALINFVFTSDSHYGITRPAFQGASNVDARVVNAALVRQMNSLPNTKFPVDGGLREGMTVDSVDFVVDTGDIANRSEVVGGTAIQSAATSWSQFEADYVKGLRLKDGAGRARRCSLHRAITTPRMRSGSTSPCGR